MFDLFRIKKQIAKANAEYSQICKKNKELLATGDKLEKRIGRLKRRENSAQERIRNYQAIISYIDRGEEYHPLEATSTDAEEVINAWQTHLALLLNSPDLIDYTRVYRIDGSEKKGKQFQKEQCNNLLYGLSAYIDNKMKVVNASNYQEAVRLVEAAFDKYNQKAQMIGATISPDYLTYKLKIMQAKLDYRILKDTERKEMREQQKRVKEQEMLLLEAEKERKRLELEKKAMNVAYGKALTDQEREQIKEGIAKIDKRLADIDYKCSHTQSGWVYLITSPSLPGMYKCGVTRQLNPVMRVNQLSSSSLPFPFVLNAYCFADDAFEIEAQMHKYFDKKRVNKDREFFYGDVAEAISVLESVFNQKVYLGKFEENDNNPLTNE